jgi:hypothetical protein
MTKKKQDHRRAKIFPSAADDADRASQSEASKLLMSTSSYQLAYVDQEFLLKDEMRPVRLMLELSKPELALKQHNIDHAVVFYGSARTHSPDSANQLVRQVQQRLEHDPDNLILQQKLRQAKVRLRHAAYYEHARKLGRLVTEQSRIEDIPDLHVITGGGPGIMEAANRGAHDIGGKSAGLNIVVPKEQKPNPYITPELCFRFHYFAIRKMHLLLRAQALVVFPGGFGTLDEFFETLTLVQTGKIKALPILLFGKEYWQKLVNFELLVEEGMIDAEDLQFFSYVDSAEEAWEIIHQDLKARCSVEKCP